jgi:hypothetical protein
LCARTQPIQFTESRRREISNMQVSQWNKFLQYLKVDFEMEQRYLKVIDINHRTNLV